MIVIFGRFEALIHLCRYLRQLKGSFAFHSGLASGWARVKFCQLKSSVGVLVIGIGKLVVGRVGGLAGKQCSWYLSTLWYTSNAIYKIYIILIVTTSLLNIHYYEAYLDS